MSHRRAALAVLLAAAAATTGPAAPPAGAAARAPATVPRCALGGGGTAAQRSALRRDVQARVQAFAHRARTTPASRRAYAAGLAAYLYGFPALQFHATVRSYPANRLIAIGELAGPGSLSVVAPNHDTLYSVAQVDLSAGPVVLETPPTGGHYAVVQLLDAFTNAFAYVGGGPRGARGERVALLPPGWHGTLPAGVRAVRAPTPTLWLLGRTLPRSAGDLPAARALLGRYALTPLAAYAAGAHQSAVVLPKFPTTLARVRPPKGLAFFDALGAALAKDPAPARDACALRAFAAAGIGAGRTPGTQLTGARRRAVRAAARDGAKLLDRLVGRRMAAGRRAAHGWTLFPKDTGHFGTDYASRAFVADVALAANTPEQAIYPSTTTDDRGRRLDGRHRYVVRFRPGQTPPVKAFWSLTLYDARILLYANPLDRYALGDRSPGLRRDADGGLTIRVSHAAPPPAQRSNWLPAPSGRFSLYLRLFEPAARAASGAWVPPPVRLVR
jgi:hypothetical protein